MVTLHMRTQEARGSNRPGACVSNVVGSSRQPHLCQTEGYNRWQLIGMGLNSAGTMTIVDDGLWGQKRLIN